MLKYSVLSIRINPACNLSNPPLRANRDLPTNPDLLCKPQNLNYTIAPEKVAMSSLDIGPTSRQPDQPDLNALIVPLSR